MGEENDKGEGMKERAEKVKGGGGARGMGGRDREGVSKGEDTREEEATD